jgi:ATP-binding cassette subfamily C (CFTR/MRP) protein 10
MKHNSSEPHNTTNISHDAVTHSTDESNITYFLKVYALFAGVNSVFTLFTALLFAYGGIHAATGVHTQMLNTVMKVSGIVLTYVENKTLMTMCLWELRS